jgi:membrane-bound serine protease (ClpP class)
MLFETVEVPLQTILPTVALVGGFFIVVAGLAFRAQRSQPKGGSEGIIGEVGVVRQRLDPEGLVFVHGEIWRAQSDEVIEPDEKVEVLEIQGLMLKVRRRGNSAL